MQRYSYNVTVNPGIYLTLSGERPSDELAAHCRAVVPDDGREHLIAFAIDARGQTVGYQIIASGTVDACMLYPRDIYCWAMLVPTARYVGVAHNHPSGAVEPSPPDVKGTVVVAGAGALVGLDLLWSMVFTHRSEAWQEVKLPQAPKMEGEDAQPKRPETPEPAPGDGEPEDGKGDGGDEPEDAQGDEPGDGREDAGQDEDGQPAGPQEPPQAHQDDDGGREGAGDDRGQGMEGAAGPVSIDDVRAAMKRLLKRAG